MLVFCDIETTGLDSSLHGVLEIYARIFACEQSWTDIADFNVLILPEDYVWSSYCLKMHTENGLLSECLVKGIPLRDAAKAFRYWLNAAFAAENQKLTFAGKDVGRFDLPFLTKACGSLSKLCHHNTLDMGSLLWRPSGSMGLLSLDDLCAANGLPKQRHRAKDDVNTCIALFERYLETRGREQAYASQLERDAFAAQVTASLGK